jgi:hypothetical protein
VFLKNICEMVGMLLPNALDAKVVDTENEQERPPVMFPKAWCDIALMVVVLDEVLFEEILCKDACLRETVHAILYFDVNCTIVGSQVVRVVGFDGIGSGLLICMCMYSGWSIRVLRWKTFRSMVQ